MVKFRINLCFEKTVQVGAHKKADQIVHLNSEVIVDFTATVLKKRTCDIKVDERSIFDQGQEIQFKHGCNH